MSDATYGQLLELAAAVALIASIVMLWRRSLEAIVRTLAVQAAAIAATSLLIGLHGGLIAEIAIAAVTLALKAVLIPWLLMRLLRTTTEQARHRALTQHGSIARDRGGAHPRGLRNDWQPRASCRR